MTAEVHDVGLATSERYGLSVHDTMILASALQADCETVWSEGVHDGLVIENRLCIRNPFRTG